MQGMKICFVTLMATAALSGGCARNEVVKNEERIIPAVANNDTSSLSKGSGTVSSSGNIAQAVSDARQSTSSQQAPQAIVYFGFDSYILTNESRDTLQSNFKMLAGKPHIQIEGHCDERGSSEYNLALGEKRARSAQNYLVTLGYPADKITTISYGKERPADQGHDEAAWAKSRRDEFRIVK